jgi:hypothetical protein
MFKADVMETLWANETWEECVGDDCKVLWLQYKGTTTKCFFDYFRPKLSKFIIHNQQPCGSILGGKYKICLQTFPQISIIFIMDFARKYTF